LLFRGVAGADASEKFELFDFRLDLGGVIRSGTL